MAKKIPNRRQDPRYGLPKALDARLEFKDGDNFDQRLPLTEIGIGGAGFRMPRKIAGVEKGAMIPNAVIRIGHTEIGVNLEILHTTRGFHMDYTCGTRFYPKTENDRNELTELISKLELLPDV